MRCCLYTWAALAALALGSPTVAAIHDKLLDDATPQPRNNDIAAQEHFYVCGSEIEGLDGKYSLLQDDSTSSSGRTKSDPDTPVFAREDDDEPNDSALAISGAQTQKDMRLFRHNGFWMFADMSVWPPATHFRCDPNKRDTLRIPDTLNMLTVCHVNHPTPPRMGFSPAKPGFGAVHLMLQTQDCSFTAGNSRYVQGEKVSRSQDNLTKLAASVSSIVSRMSEL